jgi:hypothetical protein
VDAAHPGGRILHWQGYSALARLIANPNPAARITMGGMSGEAQQAA